MNDDKWFIKKDKGYETKNYQLMRKLIEPMKAVPDFQIAGACLKIEKGEKYDSLFKFDVEQFVELYYECLQYFYRIERKYYSQGFYVYVTYDKDAIFNSQVDADQVYYWEYQKEVFNSTFKEVRVPEYLYGIAEYLKEKISEYLQWVPQKFCLLHGDLFLPNIIVIEEKPKLIDLEYIRYGPREVELSHYFMHLFILKQYFKGDAIKYFHQIFNLKLDGIDFDSVRELFIPLMFYYRTLFASMGLIGESKKIERDFPNLWDTFLKEFL